MRAMLFAATIASSLILAGCHADADDPVGQSEELKDPVRRANALRNMRNLWSAALRAGNNDHGSQPIRTFCDQTVANITAAYLESRDDTQLALAMLDMLREMRDKRSLPALREGLNWRTEVNEEQAIRAAQTLQVLEFTDSEKSDVASMIGTALEKVRSARPIDNRMRVEFVRALGALRSPAATPALVRVATAQVPEQNFLINRMAAQELAKVGDPASVDAMIRGLYLFAPDSPAMTMDDVAAQALSRIGRPALAPLLATLRGENSDALTLANAFIAKVRTLDRNAAAEMNAQQIVSEKATFALGALGFSEAYDALYAETQSDNPFRKVNGALALARLSVDGAKRARTRERLAALYGELDADELKIRIVGAMRALYDGEALSFFEGPIQNESTHPEIRIEAMMAYMLLANKAEAQGMKSWIDAHPDDPYHDNFARDTASALALALECDANISCYAAKMSDSNAAVVRKAASMLGRLGRGNAEAIAKLVEALGNPDILVRSAAAGALDVAAERGSPEGVAKIEELMRTEEGQSIWTQFSRDALPLAARLGARAQGH